LVRSDQDGDNTVHEVDVAMIGLGAEPVRVTLTAEGAGYDNTGRMEVDELVSYRWELADGTTASGATTSCEMTDELRATLVVTVESSLRFRPKVLVEVNDGP